MLKHSWKIMVLMVALLLLIVGHATTEESDLVFGNYSYRLREDGTVEITGYSDDLSSRYELTVPTEIEGRLVTRIGDRAFEHIGATKITIPDSVVELGDNPFYLCFWLEDIMISDDHPFFEVRDGVLYSKTSPVVIAGVLGAQHESYIIPEGIQEIGNYAFGLFKKTKHISLPSTLLRIGERAFESCGMTELIIPESVMEIGPAAFCGCSYITETEIPDGIEKITVGLFSSCYNLERIFLPDSIVWIDDFAFEACPHLTSITIPESVKQIGRSVFDSCSALTEIRFPDHVTALGANAMGNCESLQRVILPPSLTEIAENLCQNDKNLTEVIWPDYVETIGNNVFRDCPNLRITEFPRGVKSIGNGAFYRCVFLSENLLPDTVTTIGDEAFAYCKLPEHVILPDSITQIGTGAFMQCTMNSIELPNNLTYIADRLFRGSSLTRIVIPEYVQSIGEEVFEASRLEEAILPDGLLTIGIEAFNCGETLKKLAIPGSVISVEHNSIPRSTIIIVDEGSYMEQYCKSHGNIYKYEYSGKKVNPDPTPTPEAATTEVVAETTIDDMPSVMGTGLDEATLEELKQLLQELANLSETVDDSEDAFDTGSTDWTTTIVANPEPTSTPAPGIVYTSYAQEGMDIRSGPGIEYDVLTQVVDREGLLVLGTENNWAHVNYLGFEGYTPVDALKSEGKTSETEAPVSTTVPEPEITPAVLQKDVPEQPSLPMMIPVDESTPEPITVEEESRFPFQAYTNKKGVNVRTKPDKSAKRVAQLSKNISVSCISESTNQTGELWYEVVTENGKKGYIRSDFLDIR